MKYIPAEKLIAEIESRMEDCKLPDRRFPTKTNIVRYDELYCLRNFITDRLQEQPEVDLKREAVMFCIDHGINISPRHAEMIARHFFEFKIEE